MPKVYPINSNKHYCEDCKTELVTIAYRGLSLACPECTPDGLIDAYSVSEENI